MAANITVTAPVVGATGKTITATLGGGSGTGYAITSAAGIVPHLTPGDANAFPVASVAVSGTTLTINLLCTIGQGEAVRLDVGATSNITDSAANTPVVFTNLTMTNNSTVVVTTFTLAANLDKFEINSREVSTANAVRSSNAIVQGDDGMDGMVEFIAHATEVSFLALNNPAMNYRRDGATVNATAEGNNGFWQIKAAGSGLTAGKHLYQVTTGDYFKGVRLVGGNRTLHLVPTTKRNALSGITLLQRQSATEAKWFGAWQVQANAEQVSTTAPTGGTLEVGFTGSGLELYAVTSQYNSWAVKTDGQPAGPFRVSGVSAINNRNNMVPIVWGLDSGTHSVSAIHNGTFNGLNVRGMKVINGTRITASSAVNATSVTVASTATLKVGDWVKIDMYLDREHRQIDSIVGNTVTFTAALAKAHASGMPLTSLEAPAGSFTPSFRPRVKIGLAAGDSNTQGSNEQGFSGVPDADGTTYTWYDPRQAPMFIAGDKADHDIINTGIQGKNTAQIKTDVLAWTTNFLQGRLLDWATIWAGTNDLNQTSNATYTTALYKADVEAVVAHLVPKMAAGGKILLMPPGTPVANTTAAGLTRASIEGALAQIAAANPTTVVTISGAELFEGFVSADYADALHYTRSGRVKVAEAISPYLGISTGLGVLVGSQESAGVFVGAQEVTKMYLGATPV